MKLVKDSMPASSRSWQARQPSAAVDPFRMALSTRSEPDSSPMNTLRNPTPANSRKSMCSAMRSTSRLRMSQKMSRCTPRSRISWTMSTTRYGLEEKFGSQRLNRSGRYRCWRSTSSSTTRVAASPRQRRRLCAGSAQKVHAWGQP